MRILLTAILLSASVVLSAQTMWQGMTYQAVARDANGDPIPNQTIALQLMINYGLSIAYVEVQNVVTNGNGLFTVTVGQGTYQFGNFPSWEQIEWSAATNYALQVFADLTGGTSYQFIGTQTLRAVPYASHSRTSEMLRDSAWVVDPFGFPKALWSNNGYNVGIGTSTPTEKFEVATGSSTFRFRDNPTAGFTTTALEIIGSGSYGPLINFSTESGNGGSWTMGMNSFTGFSLYNGNLNSPASRVGIRTTTPVVDVDMIGHVRIADQNTVAGADPSAALEVNSTTGAVLLPRLTTAQRDALTPTPGMMIFNAEARRFQGFYSDPEHTMAFSDVGNSTYTMLENFDGFWVQDAQVGQSFRVLSTGALDSLSFWVSSLVGTTTSHSVSIYICQGLPTQFPPPPVGSTAVAIDHTGRYTVSFSSVTLSPGVDYFFYLDRTNQTLFPDAFEVEVSTSGTGQHPDGNMWTYFQPDANPTGWGSSANRDMRFEIKSVTQGNGWVDLH